MAGACRPGKRLSLLPLIRKHEDLVEADFSRYYPGEVYLDRYRLTEAGRPRLSMRRLLLLVDALPPESGFVSEVAERYPLSREQAAMYDVYAALAGEKHPYPGALKKQRAADRKAALIESRKAERRAQNTRYIAASRRPAQSKA